MKLGIGDNARWSVCMPERLIRCWDAFMVPEVKKYPQKVLVMHAIHRLRKVWIFEFNDQMIFRALENLFDSWKFELQTWQRVVGKMAVLHDSGSFRPVERLCLTCGCSCG